jgi:hypothetical protein
VDDEIAFAPRQFFGAALDLFERFLVSLFLPAADHAGDGDQADAVGHDPVEIIAVQFDDRRRDVSDSSSVTKHRLPPSVY